MKNKAQQCLLQHVGLLRGWKMGLEPTTPGTTIQCSNQLSYIHHLAVANIENVFLIVQLIFQKNGSVVNQMKFNIIQLSQSVWGSY